MKKFLSIALLLLLLLSSFAQVFAYEGDYNQQYYRFNDFVGVMSEDEAVELSERAESFLPIYGCDFVICVTNGLEEEDANDLDGYGEWFYRHNDFGYGPNQSGLLLVVDMDNYNFTLLSFGDCDVLLTDEAYTQICNAFIDDYAQYEPYEVYDRFLTNASALMAGGQANARENKPDWYPEDVTAFEDFLDPNAPRLVDNADAFTEAEEAAILDRINSFKAAHPESDLVVFTDKSAYGFSHAVYAADFYQFNGYGVGDDFNGSIFFLCLDPDDRGWWEAGTGKDEALFSSSTNTNRLDDLVYPHMVDGRYADGILAYIDGLDALYTDGKVPAPPKDPANWGLAGVLGAFFGLISSLVTGGARKKNMKTVAEAVRAANYLQDKHITQADNIVISTIVTSRKIEKESSGGSSGGGGSHHSRGYSSSGGRSFSGGGRRF